MSDDIDRSAQESDALLMRADMLLARRKTAVGPAPEIPVLTAAVGPAIPSAISTVPTLTDIVAPPSANDAPPSAEQNPEPAIYHKLKRRFDREIAGLPQPLPSAAVVALDQALRKVSGELKEDVDAMASAAAEKILRSRTQDPPTSR